MSCGSLDPSESLVVPRDEPQNPNVVTVVTCQPDRWNRWKMMRLGYQPWPWGHMENTCLLLLGCLTVPEPGLCVRHTQNDGAHQSKVTHI